MWMTTVIASLATDNAITSMVGDRVFPVMIPQTQKAPSIVLAIVGNVPGNTHQGVSALDQVNFDVWVEGRTYADVETLGNLVRRKLESLRTDTIQSIRYQTENDGEYNQEVHLFSRVLTFTIRVNRS